MNNYSSLKATINANIKENGNQEITGNVLNSVLNAMVNALAAAGATYKGVITPASAAPANLDQATIYLALTPGEYTNFLDSNGDPIVVESVALIAYDGGASLVFSKTELPCPWSKTIPPAEDASYIGIWIPNGGCILALDSVGNNAFHGLLCVVTNRISSATFVGSGGIDTSVDVEIGQDEFDEDIVVLKFANDQPVTITCIGGNAPTMASSSDSLVHTATSSKAWKNLESGGGSAEGAVRYDQAQSLTDAQKLQARTNIGATAPETFRATYGSTTHADVLAAFTAGLSCVVRYDGQEYYARFGNSVAIYFFSLEQNVERHVWVNNGNQWQNAFIALEMGSNKKTDIASNRTSEIYYPTTKGVFDFTSKWGKVSQTLTWNSSDNSYSVSDVVEGAIPKSFISLVEKAGATFNATSGYFELNGITNIALDEMEEIYNYRVGYGADSVLAIFGEDYKARTNFPVCYGFGTSYPNHIPSTIYCKYMAFQNASITKFAFSDKEIYVRADSANNFSSASPSAQLEKRSRLVEISGIINVQNLTGSNNFFYNNISGAWFPWLEKFNLKGLKASVFFGGMPKLSMESLAYMITYADTATITITLHADVYAAAQSDAGVQAALTTKTNVSLASA